MAVGRNIRWTIPFKSFNGNDCRVNIYDNNWPDDIDPTILTGATDPFYYNDDTSEDLLNGVVRYRTGYINFIDDGDVYKHIDEIFPSAAFDRYVQVLYGNDVAFNGYIQVQAFSDEMIPTPKVVKLPVISPLGLFEQRKFGNTQFYTPTSKTLGQLLDIALAGSYSYVYVPDDNGVGSYGYPNPVGLGMSINTLAVSPWNEDYHHAMTVNANQKVMMPETYKYLVEIICKAFGWICHDMPDALVFTAFDYDGSYIYYPVGHIGDGNYRNSANIPSAASDITGFFTPADDNANQQSILPDTGIEISYEGEFGGKFTCFDRTSFYNIVTDPSAQTTDDEQFILCNLSPVNNSIAGEIYRDQALLFSAATFELPTGYSDYRVTRGIYCVAWKNYIGILISMMSGWTDGYVLFTLRYYTKILSTASLSIKYGILRSANGLVQLMQEDDSRSSYIKPYITVNDGYVEVKFKLNIPQSQQNPFSDYELIMIHDIELVATEDSQPYASFRYLPVNASDTIPDQYANPDMVISSNITMPISFYKMNDRLIGNTVRQTKLTEYPYLLQPRQQLVSKFRLVNAPTIPYARLFSYLGKYWRLIAQEFHPWNDEYTLTLQSSPVLEP